MGAKFSSHDKVSSPSKIEKRLVEALTERSRKGHSTLRNFNSIILKFPQIDESFEAVRDVFKKFDVNRSGTIDLQELKKCLEVLEVNLTDDQIKAIYDESDLDGSREIEFKEFIVLLALVYFLGAQGHTGFSLKREASTKMGLSQLAATFETIVDAFVFLDVNGDGYLSKQEIIDSINSSTSPSRHKDRIGLSRFEEMDWDHNGQVTFKEFLFAFTDWVGLDENSDER